MHSVAAEDETDALIAEGAVREALAVLLRNHAERERRGGLGRDDAAAMEIPLRVAICYALLGMERDALEWCALAERAAVTQTSEDKLGQLSCFRLWSLVLDGRVLAAATYAETHFRRQRLGQDVFALSLSALILLALKASAPAFGRQLVDLIEAYDFGVGLGALMLQWLCTEFALREVLAALPVLEGRGDRSALRIE